MGPEVLDRTVKEESQVARGSLADLYVRYLPVARGLGYLLTGSRQDAEDLAQEAFVRVAGRFEHLRSSQSFEAYLRRTVVNLFVSRMRRKRLELAYLQREGIQAQRRSSSSEATAGDVASRHALWAILQQLPSRQRAAVVLRYYEDLSDRQIAEVLRTSVPAAKSLVRRAMDTLAEKIRGDEW